MCCSEREREVSGSMRRRQKVPDSQYSLIYFDDALRVFVSEQRCLTLAWTAMRDGSIVVVLRLVLSVTVIV
jgi:hypothetical protein